MATVLSNRLRLLLRQSSRTSHFTLFSTLSPTPPPSPPPLQHHEQTQRCDDKAKLDKEKGGAAAAVAAAVAVRESNFNVRKRLPGESHGSLMKRLMGESLQAPAGTVWQEVGHHDNAFFPKVQLHAQDGRQRKSVLIVVHGRHVDHGKRRQSRWSACTRARRAVGLYIWTRTCLPNCTYPGHAQSGLA
jgi:hypothetical protein